MTRSSYIWESHTFFVMGKEERERKKERRYLWWVLCTVNVLDKYLCLRLVPFSSSTLRAALLLMVYRWEQFVRSMVGLCTHWPPTPFYLQRRGFLQDPVSFISTHIMMLVQRLHVQQTFLLMYSGIVARPKVQVRQHTQQYQQHPLMAPSRSKPQVI